MSSRPKVNFVVIDRYTKRALKSYDIDENVVNVIFKGKNSNFKSRIDQIEELLESELNPKVEDLYRIALAAYISDLQFIRKDKIPIRTIRILISVHDSQLWNLNKQNLEAVLYQLSGDNFIFHFIQGKRKRQQNDIVFNNQSNKVISLFSGGLDSLAGVSWLLQNNSIPILVSHASQPKVTSIQRALFNEINNLSDSDIEFYQINAVPSVGKLKQQESSQRLRSFLYLSLGCLFAIQKGIARLHMFENGILALNVPISNSRIFLNTRTAHPAFLNMYEDFVSNVFGTEISITNPFLEMTKTEVISIIVSSSFQDLIRRTISCSRLTYLIFLGQPISEIWHCGSCLPCILRRISIESSTFAINDVLYYTDILSDLENIDDEGKRVIMELLEFARKLAKCTTIDEVLIDYPAFLVENLNPEPLVSMYIRYINEVNAFFSRSQFI